jgi:quinol monooxygenase YgiN
MSASTLRVVAHLKAKPGKADELRELLLSLIAPTRAESACIAYELLEAEVDPSAFTFVEEWRDGGALQQHLGSDHIKAALPRFPELLDGAMDLRRYKLLA